MGDTRGKETEAGIGEEEEEEGKLHIAREESQSYVTQENDDRSDITGRRFLSDTIKSNDTHTSCLTTYKDNNTKKDDLTGATGRRSEEHSSEDIAVSNTWILSESVERTYLNHRYPHWLFDSRNVIFDFFVYSKFSNSTTTFNLIQISPLDFVQPDTF